MTRELRHLVWGALAVVALTVFVFWEHVAGRQTFPYDFLGGYHTHAVARLTWGSLFDTPLWLPWGGFGVPAYLSLQDGAWYPPLFAFDAFGWTYDVVGATRFQVAHVAAGALGALCLARSVGMSPALSFFCACLYLFSSTFYSNAEHPDIVRGAALVPWLLLAIRHAAFGEGVLRMWALATALYLYLVAAYPGQIVAAVYACGAWAGMVAWEAHRARRLGHFARALVVAAVCAVLTALVKFLPVFADLRSVGTFPGATLIVADLLPTLLFTHEHAGLPYDISMRSLYLPSAGLLLALFISPRVTAWRLGVVLVIVAVLFASSIPGLTQAVSHLPGTRISRFQLSDFRPFLHLGLALAAGGALTQAMATQRSFAAAAFLCTGLLLGAVILAARVGYTSEQLWLGSVTAMVSFGCVLAVMAARGPRARQAGMAALLVWTVISGATYWSQNAWLWRTPRSDAQEMALYGRTIREHIASARNEPVSTPRPARLAMHEQPMARAELYDLRYNRSWYSGEHAAYGYEDLKGSSTFQRLYELPTQGGASPDLRFLLASGRVLLTDRLPLDDSTVVACALQGSCGTAAKVALLQRDHSWSSYAIESSSPFVLVENEPFYDGWASSLCQGSSCQPGPTATRARDVLRAWALPAGRYEWRTHFEPPAWALARSLSALGLFVWVALLAGGLLSKLPGWAQRWHGRLLRRLTLSPEQARFEPLAAVPARACRSQSIDDGLAVMLVNFGTNAITARGVASALAAGARAVVVVDNPCPGASPFAWVDDSPVQVVRAPDNLGFAAGTNLGLASLLERDDWDYLLLLNSDAELLPAFRPAYASARRERVRVGACRVDRSHAPGSIESHGMTLHLSMIAANRTSDHDPLLGPTGACMLLRREVVEQTLDTDGYLLAPHFFCYAEDTDLCVRLVLRGEQPESLGSEALAMHHGQASSGGANSDFVAYFGLRNTLWMQLRCLPCLTLLRYSFWMALSHGGIVVKYASQQRLLLLAAVWTATVAAWPRLWRERRALRDTRMLPSDAFDDFIANSFYDRRYVNVNLAELKQMLGRRKQQAPAIPEHPELAPALRQ